MAAATADAKKTKRPTAGAKTLKEKAALAAKATKSNKAIAVSGKPKPKLEKKAATSKASTPAKPKAAKPAVKAAAPKAAAKKPSEKKTSPVAAPAAVIVKAAAIIGRPVEIPGKKRVTVDVTEEIVKLTLGLSNEKLGLEAGKKKSLSPYFRKAIIAQLEADGVVVKVKC